MKPDLEKYRPHFEGFDLTEDQKSAMIEALWSIAEMVADLAYGLHPAQLASIADDNDSMSESNVIEFFRQADSDPILDQHAAFFRWLAADNDNDPQHQDQEKETQRL
jgi:hypothetical protein